jgi:hypothetical protein
MTPYTLTIEYIAGDIAYVTCKEASISQAFEVDDLPDLIKDIQNLID